MTTSPGYLSRMYLIPRNQIDRLALLFPRTKDIAVFQTLTPCAQLSEGSYYRRGYILGARTGD
jgi:hypothetical protein